MNYYKNTDVHTSCSCVTGIQPWEGRYVSLPCDKEWKIGDQNNHRSLNNVQLKAGTR